MKKTVMFVKIILIISSIFLICCKQTKEELYQELLEMEDYSGWNEAISGSDLYFSIGQHLYYYKDGKTIGNAATLTQTGWSWGMSGSSRGGGNVKVFPDSVFVHYTGLNDKNQMYDYAGGMKLPEKKIELLFKKGYIRNGKHERFNDLITGMGPGGRICVWLDHVEIKRGKVQELDKFKDYPSTVFGDSIKIYDYLKHHPVAYSNWDKPDPRFRLDFGFCSEDNHAIFWFMEFISKEGIRNMITEYYLDMTQWNIPSNMEVDYEGKFYTTIKNKNNFIGIQLPVYVGIAWRYKKQEFSTGVSLPKNFPQKFTKSYTDPVTGEQAHYNRLVFGVEKDGVHCMVWLDGPNKQEKLMRFKGQFVLKDETGKWLDRNLFATEVTYY